MSLTHAECQVCEDSASSHMLIGSALAACTNLCRDEITVVLKDKVRNLHLTMLCACLSRQIKHRQ